MPVKEQFCSYPFQSHVVSPQLNDMRQPSHFDYAFWLTEMAKACLHVTMSSAAGEAASAHIVQAPVPIMKGKFSII